MQLIYIWIKKFRNIEGQGFTFSPEYKIQYNQVILHLYGTSSSI